MDSASSHTILRSNIYFTHLVTKEEYVNTIIGSGNVIEGSGRAIILFPGGTKFIINNALLSTKSLKNLLSFKDIRRNGYHIKTMNEKNHKYLCITTHDSNKKVILEKLPSLSSGLYYTKISAIESHATVNQKFTSPNEFITWHDRLDHPGTTMMRRIIENSHGHSLKNQKILKSSEFCCAACSQGKLILRPSPVKIGFA